MEMQDLISREVWWEQDLMENWTLMALDQDSTELDRHLINEDQLLEKKHEEELEQQAQLQDQEHTTLIWILLIKEGEDLEKHIEMEETQFQILQVQDNTKVSILLEKMDQNSLWEEDIIYHKAKTHLALVLIIIKVEKMALNTQLATNQILN